MKPQNTNKPPYKCNWKIIVDLKKIFMSPRSAITERQDIRLPPKYKRLLCSAHNEVREKHTKMSAVAKNAVEMMVGLIAIACSSSGPRERPVHAPKPHKYDKRFN